MSHTTLGAVLLNADELSLDAVLFLPYGEVWNSTTRCAVIAVDRYADEEHVPDLAAQNNLERALQIAQVLDVVVDARQQRNQLTVDNLVTAFLFYYERDAFIIFDLVDEHIKDQMMRRLFGDTAAMRSVVEAYELAVEWLANI